MLSFIHTLLKSRVQPGRWLIDELFPLQVGWKAYIGGRFVTIDGEDFLRKEEHASGDRESPCPNASKKT